MRITLPDGVPLLAHGRLAVARRRDPDFALYLDSAWDDDGEVTWPHTSIEWPDFGLPADEDALFDAVFEVYDRAEAGQLVEVASFGGLGRTGAVLGCLTVVAGIRDPRGAIDWVRGNYHPSAIETPEQVGLVTRFAETRASR